VGAAFEGQQEFLGGLEAGLRFAGDGLQQHRFQPGGMSGR
jgi:hypothetical protein